MGFTDKLMQVVNGARKRRRSRDPDSYAAYELDQDFERKRAEQERKAQEDRETGAREKDQRTHDFAERYAVEHEEHVEGERAKRPDSS